MNPFHHFRRNGEAYNCTKCGASSDSGSPVAGCEGPQAWETPLGEPPLLTADDTMTEWLKSHDPNRRINGDKIRVID